VQHLQVEPQNLQEDIFCASKMGFSFSSCVSEGRLDIFQEV